MPTDAPTHLSHEQRFYEQPELWGKGLNDYQRRAARDLLTVLPLQSGSLLDAGAGDGVVTALLADRYDVTALDISAEALAHVTTRSIRASIAAMPFANESFDIVTASDVIEHVPDVEYASALAECARVARSCVAITVPYREPLDAMRTTCGACGCVYHINHHQRSFDDEALVSLLPKPWRCAAVVYTGLALSPEEAAQRDARAALGVRIEWDRAVCPACGETGRSVGDAEDDRAKINELAGLLVDPQRDAVPLRNEAIALYVRAAAGEVVEDGDRLVAYGRSGRAELRDIETGSDASYVEPKGEKRLAIERTIDGVPRVVFLDDPEEVRAGTLGVPGWMPSANRSEQHAEPTDLVRSMLLRAAEDRRRLIVAKDNADGLVAELAKARDDAERRLADAVAQRESATASLKEAEGRRAQEEGNVRALKAELAGVIQNRDEQLSRLQEEISEASRRHADEVSRAHEQTASLNARLEDATASLECAEADLATATGRAEQAERDAERAREERDRYESQLRTRSGELEAAERALSDKAQELGRLRVTVDEIRSRLEDVRREARATTDRLETEVADARAETARHRADAETLEQALAAANSSATAAAEAHAAETADLRTRLDEAHASAAFAHRMATEPLFRWRVRLKSAGRGVYESKADVRRRIESSVEPGVIDQSWSEKTEGARSFLMLCHDQRIDRRIVHQAHALLEAGWHGKIIAMSFDANDHLDTESGVEVHRIGLNRLIPDCPAFFASQYRQRWINWLGLGHATLSRLNDRVYRWSTTWRYRGTTIGHPMPFDLAYIAAGRQYPADLIVGHDLPAVRAVTTLGELTGARTMYDAHELYPEQRGFSRAQRKMLNLAERTHAPKIGRVTTVSRSFGEIIQKKTGIQRFEVIRNVTHRREPRPERGRVFHDKLGLPEQAKVVLFQGSIVPDQNLHTLVEGFVKLARPDTHLVFLGPAEPKTDAKLKACAGSQLGERVHFLEPVGQDVLLDHTSSAHFGVIPYLPYDLNCRYCMPNKLFEYIQAGLPILASDLVEIRGVIEGIGGGGMLADLAKPSQMAAALVAMLDRDLDADRAALLEAAVELCWEVEKDRYLEVVEEVMQAGASR